MLYWLRSDGREAPVFEGQTREVTEADGRRVKVVGRDGRPNSAPTNIISNLVEMLEEWMARNKS